jgi:hypothetical protein
VNYCGGRITCFCDFAGLLNQVLVSDEDERIAVVRGEAIDDDHFGRYGLSWVAANKAFGGERSCAAVQNSSGIQCSDNALPHCGQLILRDGLRPHVMNAEGSVQERSIEQAGQSGGWLF